MKSKTHPDFIIAGFSKCGTTSLSRYLDEHPSIYMTKPKEPRFYVASAIERVSREDPLRMHLMRTSILKQDRYERLYSDAPNDTVLTGEASIHYANHPDIAIPAITAHAGDIPIILLVRDPISRAVSNWRYIRFEHESFESAISLEEKRKEQGYNSFWWYKFQGVYAPTVEAFFNHFSRVKVLRFETFVEQTQACMDSVYRFLKLPTIKHESFDRHNYRPSTLMFNNSMFKPFATRRTAVRFLAVTSRWRFLRLALSCISQPKTTNISNHVREELQAFYSTDKVALETFFNTKSAYGHH